jgi:DNA-binding protein H-NS
LIIFIYTETLKGYKQMPKLTLSAVEKRIAALQKVADKLKKKDKAPAIKSILAMMAKHDVSVADLRSPNPRSVAGKTRARKPVNAKYQDPDTGKTWSGRGRTPLWLSSAERSGKSRDAFLIK